MVLTNWEMYKYNNSVNAWIDSIAVGFQRVIAESSTTSGFEINRWNELPYRS